MRTTQVVERGKPASYGQEIVKRRSRIVARYLQLSGKLILDFGCGNGAQTLELAKVGGEFQACDIDVSDISILKEFTLQNDIKNVQPVLYDGHLLPFVAGSLDVAVSFCVLEHVDDEIVALAEIHRVLKKGGEFVISVPNKWWIFETHGARLPILTWNHVPFISWLPSKIHQKIARARIYRKKRILSLLQSAGFSVKSVTYMTAPMDGMPSVTLQGFLRKFVFRRDTTRFPNLSTEIFVYCKKLDER